MIGDVIRVVFHYKNYPMAFTGMCIAIRKKNFTDHNTGLVLRNVIVGVGVEVIVSYYCNRSFNLKYLNHSRKFYFYNRAKLYYLRGKTNTVSKI